MVLLLKVECTLVQSFQGASWYHSLVQDTGMVQGIILCIAEMCPVCYRNTEAEIIQAITCSREAKITSQQRCHLDRFWRNNRNSPGREKNFRSSHTSCELHITMQKYRGMGSSGISSTLKLLIWLERWEIVSKDKISSFDNQWTMKKGKACAFLIR